MAKLVINSKYSSIATSDARYFLVTGGRGSGKSFSINTMLSLLMLEDNRTILFLRKTLTSAHLSIIPEFKEKLDILGLSNLFDITKTEIINKINGSAIYFRGIQTSSNDNTANLKSINNVSVLVIDEAEELTDEMIFDRIDLSVRQKGVSNKVIIILNPATKEHWIYKRFFEEVGVNGGFNGRKNNVEYIHTTYLDNKENLDDSFLDQIDRVKERSPEKYKHQILGGWLDKAEGVIFTNWVIGDFHDTGYILFGADFGFSVDPTTLVEVSIDRKAKRIYIKEHLCKPGMTTSDIQHAMSVVCRNKQIIADSAEPRLIEELRRSGLNIKGAVKGPGSITAGIALMLDYELIVSPESVNVVKELNNYSWHDKKSNTPIDAYNHCFVGDTLISTDSGFRAIKDVSAGDMVLTRGGYRPVITRFDNGIRRVFRYLMRFDTFSLYLSCTQDHLIYTEEEGWIRVSKLRSGMTVILDNCLTEEYSGCIPESVISHEASQGCTALYGNTTTEKYPMDGMCITSTRTHMITGLKTLKSGKESFIKNGTGRSVFAKTQNGLRIFRQRALKRLPSGMVRPRVSSGTGNTRGASILDRLFLKTGLVRYARKAIHQNSLSKDFVTTTASLDIDGSEASTTLRPLVPSAPQSLLKTSTVKLKLVHVDVASEWEEEVYDLMVDGNHEYFANGLLVHNCIDSTRYAVSEMLNGSGVMRGSLARALRSGAGNLR